MQFHKNPLAFYNVVLKSFRNSSCTRRPRIFSKNIHFFRVAFSFLIILSIHIISTGAADPYSYHNALILNEDHPLFSKPLDLKYRIVKPKPEFENLVLFGDEGQHGLGSYDQHARMLGIFMRALAYENITNAVEKKYGLPKNLLMTMIMQESNGINYMPNGRNDGGIGLIHMQPIVAKQFGLNTFSNCSEMVCFKHGTILKDIILSHPNSPEYLYQYDDRFHPILNIDAAGRILKYYSELKALEEDKWDSALKRFTGKYNYEDYKVSLKVYEDHLNDPIFMTKVELFFNMINPHLRINGEIANFRDFIHFNHEFNRNFGLDAYLSSISTAELVEGN